MRIILITASAAIAIIIYMAIDTEPRAGTVLDKHRESKARAIESMQE